MQILESDKKVLRQLAVKLEKLKHIAVSKSPINSTLEKAHQRRVMNAKSFLNEIQEVSMYVGVGLNIKLVPLRTFEKQVKKAEFVTMELDGKFCKIAIIHNYPYEDIWLIYVASVESI